MGQAIMLKSNEVLFNHYSVLTFTRNSPKLSCSLEYIDDYVNHWKCTTLRTLVVYQGDQG